MAGYTRNTPPATGGGGTRSTTTTGPTSGTNTTITGPSSSTTSGSSSSRNNSNTSTSSNSVTNGSRTNRTTGTVVTNNQNMDSNSLAALQSLIASLQQGGSADDRARWDQIQSEIGANQAQREQYSKEQSFADSTAAAQARSFEALQQMVPTITAGIDSAGTSGSSMAALLTQNAADAAARSAAQLQLEAAIGYGQIANSASANATELLKIDNPVTSQLLNALEIAKGAVTSSTQTTDMTEGSKWNETTNTTGTSNTTGSSSESSTQTTNNSGGVTTQNSSQGPQTTTQTVTPISSGGRSTAGPKNPGLGQNLITPSSYRGANIVRNGNKYSQF